jgi:hypothetical protein
MEDLPNEIINCIIEYIPINQLIRIESINKRWRDIINKNNNKNIYSFRLEPTTGFHFDEEKYLLKLNIISIIEINIYFINIFNKTDQFKEEYNDFVKLFMNNKQEFELYLNGNTQLFELDKDNLIIHSELDNYTAPIIIKLNRNYKYDNYKLLTTLSKFF